jgi:serine/threonine-protein kinase
LTEAAAIDAIEAAGLNYAGSNDVPSDQPSGIVVGSDPDEGETVDAGSDVTLDVSNGEVQVPDVIGDSESTARTRLETEGFNVTVVYEETDSATAGTVIEQSPTGDDYARLGTTVVITVATAPPAPSDSASPSPSDSTTNNGGGNGNPP